MLDDFIIVAYFLLVDRLAEWPRVLMLEQHFEDLTTLIFEATFIGLLFSQV